jgi:mycothione reductase
MHAEILIIGAGTAGLRTALTAAANGKKTIVIGTGPLGGTCLNNGCIPTKTMLHAADVLRVIQNARTAGVSATGKPDFKKMMRRVRAISKEGRDYALHAINNNTHLTYIEGAARFVAKKVVEVNNVRITADKIIIATGTVNATPPIPGLADVPYLTNVESVELTSQPKHLLIIGGGYIACEYATFFATLGTQVTIVERAPTILGVLDEDVRSVVYDSLAELGVRMLTGVATSQVSFSKKKYKLGLSGASVASVSGDALLVATGRTPNTKNLGLEDAGVEIDGRGFIVVDSQLRSSNKNVYAIGDVNGLSLFAHSAKRQGWLALEHILLSKRTKFDPGMIPWAVFTHPIVGGVGLSELQAQKQGIEYGVLTAHFSTCGKAKVIDEIDGFVKVLHSDGRILGATIVGPDADNLVHEFVALMHTGSQGIRILNEMVHAHPTLAEVFESLTAKR